MSNRTNNPSLSNDQRTMLNFYLAAYDDIRSDIDRLHGSLDHVVSHINTLSRNIETQRTDNTNRVNQTRHNLRSNANTSRHRNASTTESIFNDYLYNNLVPPRFTRNEIPRPQNTAARSNNQLLDFLGQFYNNVPIVPTRQQIDTATRRVIYREIEAPLNSSCPICLDRFQPDDNVMQIIRCGHIFNEDSINLWFRTNVRCPICRHDIRETGTSASTNPVSRPQTLSQPLRTNATSENGYYETDDEEDVENQDIPTMDASFNAINTSIENPPDVISSNPNQGEPRQNLRVERDPVTNAIDRLSYDLSDETFISNITNLAGDLLFGNRSEPIQYNNGNQRFAYDPSSNVIMFETYFQRRS